MPDLQARAFRAYGGQVVDLELPAMTNVVILAKSTTRVVTVYAISYTPATYIAAVMSFTDSLTGKPIGSLTIPGGGPGVVEGANQFRLAWPGGTKLSVGANLLLAMVSGTALGRLHVEAVQKGH